MLAQVLATNHGLEGLKLDNTEIGDAGVVHLAQVLPRSQLRSLSLRGCMLGVRAVTALTTVLSLQEQPPPMFHYLCLDDNPLKDAGAQALTPIFEKALVLGRLDLHNCSIEDGGAISIATALKSKCARLSILHLEQNPLTVVGCKALALMAQTNKSLEVLSFPNHTLAGEELSIMRLLSGVSVIV